MAQTVAVVRQTMTGTGGGTTDFTSSGFGTPTAAILVYCNANTTNNPQTGLQFSIGFWDGTNQRCIGIAADDAVGTTVCARSSDDSYGIAAPNGSGGSLNQSFAVSAVTDGIRVTKGGSSSTTRYGTVLLLKGVSSSVHTITCNATADGTTASASLGFAPKLIFFLTISDTTADVVSGTRGTLSFGFAEIGGTQRSISWRLDTGSATETPTLLYSETRCVAGLASGALDWSGEVTTFGADTYTITTRDSDTGGLGVTFALALGGADLSYDCGTLTTPTSTGNDVVSTDIAPDALLAFLSTATGTTLHTDSGANGIMLGMATASTEFSHTGQVEDAADTTNTNSAASATAVVNLDSSSGGSRTDMCDATVTLNSSDFTLNYSATDGTARKGWWVAFGAAGGGATWWGGSNAASWNRIVVNRD